MPGAESLVENKWNATERLANESVNMARGALQAISGSFNTALSAGLGPGSVSPSGGGSADVTYQHPEQPGLPDLGFETPYRSGATYGGNADSVSYAGVGNPPVFSGTPPGSGTGITPFQTDRLPDFLNDYTNPLPVSYQAPNPPGDFNASFAPPTVSAFAPPNTPGDFTETVPGLTPRSEPTLTASRPGNAPTITPPSYPLSPSTTKPGAPQKYSIPLPTLRIPDLSGIDGLLDEIRNGKPVAPVLQVPDDSFLETFDALRHTLEGELEKVLPIEEVLTWMLAGDSIGIPAHVALMLRDRAFAAEDQLAYQAETEALNDWWSRGFTLPGGSLETKLAMVRQQNRDKKAELNRNLWIEEAKLEIENLRFAIQQGIAYQGMLWDNKIKLWGLCGDLATKFIDVQLKVLDATLAMYKAQLDAWQTEASVYKDYINALLQAELGKLEITKTEAEISKLFVALNQQEVDLYKAELEGVMIEVNLYKAQIEAANSRLQAESLKLEAFAKSVQVYTASVQAYEAEWRGYAAAVQADSARIEAFKAQVQAYGTQVQAYGTQVEAEKTRIAAEVSVGQFSLEAYKAEAQVYSSKVEAFGKQVQAEAAKVQAETEIQKLPMEAFKAKAQAYAAQADAYGKRSQAEAARIQGEVEVAKLPIEIYKGQTQAYAAQVEAYGKRVQAARDEATAKVEIEKLALEAFRNELEAYKAELAKASTEIEAKTRIHGSQVQLFGTLVESEKARVSAELQNIDQALRQTQFETSIELKKAELEQTKAIELARIALSADQEVARVASQLAGAALSAVNASASIGQSYSASRSVGCSENYNYDMSS
jgi:uncharacterized protein YpmS